MSGFIKSLGVLFIALGVLGAVLAAREIPFEDYRIAKQVYQELPLNEFAEATYRQALTAVQLGAVLAAAVGLGGATTGTLLLGLGAILDRLDVISGQKNGGAKKAEPAPVRPVTCPSCGERQQAPADKPHYNCAKCGAPVIRDWVQLGQQA